MSTQELIAAVIRIANAFDAKTAHEEWMQQELRAACACAMIVSEVEIAEVERLMDAFGASCNSVKKFGHITSLKPIGQQIVEYKEARTALLDAVRAMAAERDHFRDAVKVVPDGWKLVQVTSQGVQFGNAWYSHESITGYDAQRLNSGACRMTARQYMDWVREARAAAVQPVGEPAENSYEWFQREIQRLQQHVAETWPDWMKRTSGLSTATFPTVGEVPMPEPEGRSWEYDQYGNGRFVLTGDYTEEQMVDHGDHRYQEGYKAGVTSGAKQMFDAMQFAAANTTDAEWDERLCECSESALESVSPEAHSEWKNIQLVAKESHQQGYAAGVAARVAAGGEVKP